MRNAGIPLALVERVNAALCLQETFRPPHACLRRILSPALGKNQAPNKARACHTWVGHAEPTRCRWQRHLDCGIVVVADNAGEAGRDARPRQVAALITTSLARERAEALIGIESIVNNAEKAEAMYELLPPDHCPASLERAHR